MTDAKPTALQLFAFLEPVMHRVAASLTTDPDAVMTTARERFGEIAPTLAYRENPAHPMAMSLNICSGFLALYLPLRERGVGVHDFGPALHREVATIPPPPEMLDDGLVGAAEESLAGAQPGEFVFSVTGSPAEMKFDLEIHSCGICHLFAKYDAMDLVPYMCAMDDLMSDQAGHGLRRTGTIALGADHCDFHYERGGEPLRLAEQYPDRLHL